MSTESRTVRVSNLSANTTKECLSQFIGFCGQIESLELDGKGAADVLFAKESAAHTATLLNGGTLDGNALSISSVAGEAAHDESGQHHEGEDIEQEAKPRSAVLAELLAHGYQVSDTALEKAIAVDGKYGISQRFLSFFTRAQSTAKGLDEKHGVSTKAKDLDTKYGIGERAEKSKNLGLSYYQKGVSSPWGAKLVDFYTTTTKQAKDIHEEAMRIKASKTGQAHGTGVSASSKDAEPIPATANEPLEKSPEAAIPPKA